MTRREAERLTRQADTLRALGFTVEEAETLRRISLTLHRWSELECGTDHACLVRGAWNRDTQTFDYDEAGAPYYEFAGGTGKHRYARTPDRERGALRRLEAIVKARNTRQRVQAATGDVLGPATSNVAAYVQGDPRGCALYILRPGDVPDGKDVGEYYSRGIAVY